MAGSPLPVDDLPNGRLKRKGGLRAKLVRVYVLQVSFISIAALIGLSMTYLIVVNVLSREALVKESVYFWDKLANNPEHQLPDVANMVGYLSVGEDLSAVPVKLRSLRDGFGRAEQAQGAPLVFVSRRDDKTLYLVLAETRIADLVFYFGLAPLATVLLVVYGLFFVSYRLSHQAISPLLNLAQTLEDFDFRSNQPLVVPVTPEGVDRETGLMVEALQTFGSRLEQFIERERTFTRDAGHELRTPIAVMKGSLDILENRTDRPIQDVKVHARMRRVVKDMETLLETLLLLAREEDVYASDNSTNVNQVIAEEVELLQEFAELQGNRIDWIEGADAHCAAKPRVLGIIMSNLIRNALTYTQNGTVTICVEREFVAVRDTGIGMSDDEMDKIFTAFYRSEAAKSSGHGQGLGLALVRRLVQQLGWTVEVSSQEQVGTEFKVWFDAP
ncbi:MAG: HAMP domain-containing histidine kinase [Gammaproteobacteria bacterium]|nr:HAMP domain-containing histidine kinase [Gammaproteobacteria bacterium]